MQLHMKVEVSSVLRIGSSSGKVEIDLVKCVPSIGSSESEKEAKLKPHQENHADKTKLLGY